MVLLQETQSLNPLMIIAGSAAVAAIISSVLNYFANRSLESKRFKNSWQIDIIRHRISAIKQLQETLTGLRIVRVTEHNNKYFAFMTTRDDFIKTAYSVGPAIIDKMNWLDMSTLEQVFRLNSTIANVATYASYDWVDFEKLREFAFPYLQTRFELAYRSLNKNLKEVNQLDRFFNADPNPPGTNEQIHHESNIVKGHEDVVKTEATGSTRQT